MPAIRRSLLVLLLSVPPLLVADFVRAPREAVAEEIDVEALIDLIRVKPRGMSRPEWKEQRRDAVKKLGRAGDKTAVPVLIEVVENEEFDIVGEFAIEALGKLGDQRAVPVLRKVAADKSRDRQVRSLAEKALSRLGASPEESAGGGETDSGQGEPDKKDEGTETGTGESGTDLLTSPGPGGSLIGSSSVPIPSGPKFDDEVIGATEHLTLAAGAASLQYDTIRSNPAFDGKLSASYERGVDRKSWAYRYGGELQAAGGVTDYDNPDADSKFLALSSTATAEARFYLNGQPIYGLLQGAGGVSFLGAVVDRPDDDDSVEEYRSNFDVHVGLGVGYGRMLDVGEALRLRRIERVLRRARVLGRPITADLAERIMSAWWSLRGELGAHRRLVVTVAMLREAGVLLGEPDAGTSYEILQVLLDGQLTHRLRGFDAHLGVSESFLYRDDETPTEDGRIESVLAKLRYGKQSESGAHELVAECNARYRILGEDTDPTPWEASAAAAWRHYRYGRHFDPVGALEIAAEAAISNDGFDPAVVDLSTAGRLAGRLGWIWSPNRASTVRASATASVQSGEYFLGLSLEATYGLLDVGFVGPQTYRSLGGSSAAAE